MIVSRGLIGQQNPSGTNPAEVLRVYDKGMRITVRSIVIANVTGGGLAFRVFILFGSQQSVGVGNALYYDVAIAANTTFQENIEWVLGQNQSLVVRSSAGNGLAFSLFGEVEKDDE